GDRVAIVLGSGPEFFDALFGAQAAGAVPVPLYPPVRLGRLDEYHAATARMLAAVGARLLITDGRIRRLLGRTVERARPPLGCRTTAELAASARGEIECRVQPDALAVIQFSSGSTTAPKPVAITHRNLMAQCSALAAMMPLEPDERRGVIWLPLYHDMGLVGTLMGAYYPGTVVGLPPEAFLARPALWLRALSRHRAATSTAPDFAYALCTQRIRDAELRGVDLSAWRYALDGAEPISREVLRRFAARFAAWGLDPRALTPVYGLSEATLALTFSPPRRGVLAASVDARRLALEGAAHPGERALVSVGRPVPGAEVELRGADGRAVAERRVGRIFARGPSVTAGYFRDPAATRAALAGGWLDTGDLGFVDEGELYVCGRAKDVVIVRGANHAPQEFEECLDGVDGVRPGCAVAVGFDAGAGEALMLLVERRGAPDPALAARVRAAVLERTGVRAERVEILAPGTLPRTSSGKRRRAEALRRYVAGQLAPPRKVSTLRVAAEALRSALAFARVRFSE